VLHVIQTKDNEQTLQDFYLYIQNKTTNKDNLFFFLLQNVLADFYGHYQVAAQVTQK
jgi:hypothetical protein